MADNTKINLSSITKFPIDFEDIVLSIKRKLQQILPNAWTDWIESNVGILLLEGVSYETMMLLYYVNAALNECYLSTTRTREGAFRIAKTMGYKPRPAKQSVVTLRFSIDKVLTTAVEIPIFTVCNYNDIQFYTTESATIEPGYTYVDVPAKSGKLVTDTFICNGLPEYKYQLSNNNVNDIIAVTVNGLQYEYVDFMDINNSEGLYYTIQYDSDYFGYLSFGDGTYGVLPSANQIIKVFYVYGADSSNNIEAGKIKTIQSTIYDSNNSIVYCNVTNPENAYGGADCENIKTIKRNVPTIYKTQKRGVTLTDFEDLLYYYGGISKCKAIDNSLMDEIGIYGVKLCIIPDSTVNEGLYASEAFKTELLNYFDEKKITSNKVEIIDPSYIKFNVTVTANVLPTYNRNILRNNIKNVISNYLSYTNREFGEEVSKNDIYNAIMNIDGISTIDTLTMEEYRNIYVSETPTYGTNIIKLTDSTNMLNVGSVIAIMNSEGEIANDGAAIVTISNIDNDEYTLVNSETGENYYITSDSGIAINCSVNPILYTSGISDYNEKYIYVRNTSTSDSTVSKRNMVLQNLCNSTVYFGDDKNTTYKILYRVGDKLYIDKPLESAIPDGTKITVLYKNMIPIMATTSDYNSDYITLTEYPRFSTGAYLIKKENPTYSKVSLTMYRKMDSNIDNIANYINADEVVSITKVYKNANTVYEKGTDYTISEDNLNIIWTDVGMNKILANDQYFTDVVVIKNADNETRYYVKSISGKKVFIQPALKTKLPEGTVFTYQTDIFNLAPYEIGDVGNITVNLNS